MPEICIWKYLENIYTLEGYASQSRWTHHINFKGIYIRKGFYSSHSNKFSKAIVIANITAKRRGKGYFTNLISEIRNKFPDLPIILENVLDERFQKKLLKMGFKIIKSPHCPEWETFDCFVLQN